MNREQWLIAGAKELEPMFKRHGHKVPACRYTCGFPSKRAMSRKRRRIGECWDKGCSQDSTFEILISPVLAKPVDVLAVLLHEMIHAVVGLECGHKGPFGKLARAVGLEGRASSAGPKQGTRMLKACCIDCGYTIRLTRKWVDAGLPTCCCGGEFVEGR